MTEMQILVEMSTGAHLEVSEETIPKCFLVDGIEKTFIGFDTIYRMQEKGFIERKDLTKWTLTQETQETIIRQQ